MVFCTWFKGLSAILEVGENVNKDNNADINSEDINNEPKNTASNYDTTIDERHYASLNKEQRKSKPNKAVVNKYLNVEFASRKERLQAARKEDRPRFINDTYPCFKDPSEVCTVVSICTFAHAINQKFLISAECVFF